MTNHRGNPLLASPRASVPTSNAQQSFLQRCRERKAQQNVVDSTFFAMEQPSRSFDTSTQEEEVSMNDSHSRNSSVLSWPSTATSTTSPCRSPCIVSWQSSVGTIGLPSGLPSLPSHRKSSSSSSSILMYDDFDIIDETSHPLQAGNCMQSLPSLNEVSHGGIPSGARLNGHHRRSKIAEAEAPKSKITHRKRNMALSSEDFEDIILPDLFMGG